MDNLRRFAYKRILKALLFLSCLMCFLPFPGLARDFTLSIQPYLPASELVKRFTPLAEGLGRHLGNRVRIKVSKNYETHIDAAGRDQADITYLGPAPYVKMVKRYGRKPLLARLEVRNSPVYYGMIIVRDDSPFQSVADLAGRSFAFGDRDSTMSHLVPRYMLHEAGIELADLGRHEFLGTHHDVALAVLGGYYDAGGIKEEVLYAYQQRGLKMLAKSMPVSEHLFVARGSMDAKTLGEVKGYLLGLENDGRGLEILRSIKDSATGITSVTDEDYDPMRMYMAFGEKEKSEVPDEDQ